MKVYVVNEYILSDGDRYSYENPEACGCYSSFSAACDAIKHYILDNDIIDIETEEELDERWSIDEEYDPNDNENEMLYSIYIAESEDFCGLRFDIETCEIDAPMKE